MTIPDTKRLTIDGATVTRLRARLERLYSDDAPRCLTLLLELIARQGDTLRDQGHAHFTERDVVLITYADQIRGEGKTPLATLRAFLADHGLDRLINTVHLLPFFPYSSDDGFSVIDYRAVDPAAGTWADVRALGARFALMFDLVLNHVSRKSRWFEGYIAGRAPYTGYFIEAEPGPELNQVVRPRSLPLLTDVETSRGTRHVWTTFSDDQIDLNFANPDVLLEIIEILLFYIREAARIVRLDAIAYLWKELGTSCIHLPQTHEVVKLLRDVVDAAAPGTWLLTETNVPHRENVSYFGDGDEAHMVYQFSLAPLLLDALLSEDAGPLAAWLAELEPAPPGATYLNFTASHDGVGVRPLEGLVSEERRDRLVAAVAARGGLVSTRRDAQGRDVPYELNVSYFDALGEPDGLPPKDHARRFLASQAVMLALRGIPAIYFHSLVGTPNNAAGVEKTGRARTINRRKFTRDELEAMLDAPRSAQAAVFEGYRHLLTARLEQQAFHPDAAQQVLDAGNPAVLAFLRTSTLGQRVLVAANFSRRVQEIGLSEPGVAELVVDLLDEAAPRPVGGRIVLQPFQVAWLTATIDDGNRRRGG